MVPIPNAAGRFVAYFKWQPERPGQALLGETLPASLGLLAVIGLVIALLLFGLARSTAALDKARADALHRATHDPLTGLANRALFNERLERSPLPLALLALDLDRFKHVNDTMGHEAGDELLKQVANRLTYIVGDAGIVARLGGDEFMVLVPGAKDSTLLADLAGKIVTAIAEPFRLGRETANIGVSVGIATALTDERKDLVSRADFALYDAKESGRNTFRVFDQLQKAA
jgi:diguanylate cyclase (GGDEF)-like protein